jgi:peptidoglycan-associated lipoprotein
VNRPLWAGVVGFAALLLAGCATQAPPAPPSASYLVLLNNSDGSTGQVRLSNQAGTTTLSKAGQASRLAGPPGQIFEVNRATISRDFGAALDARPPKPVSFVLYFQVGGARLAPESEIEVGKVLAEIAARPVPDISIIGHTDTAGDADANERLGLERARYVATLFGGTNLEPRNILIESHGEKNLLVPTPDNTAEPRNRRVEVTVR